MEIKKLKDLVKREIDLRGCVDREQMEMWVKAVRELRYAVPDWSSVVLDLISDIEQLKADVIDLELESQRGKECF